MEWIRQYFSINYGHIYYAYTLFKIEMNSKLICFLSREKVLVILISKILLNILENEFQKKTAFYLSKDVNSFNISKGVVNIIINLIMVFIRNDPNQSKLVLILNEYFNLFWIVHQNLISILISISNSLGIENLSKSWNRK